MIQYWVLCLLSITINIFADETLYETLKQLPLPKTSYLYSSEFVTKQFPIKDEFSSIEAVSNSEGGDYLPHFINVNEELPYRYKEVIEDSVYLQLIMISSIALLAVMPEDITNWNAAKLQEKSLSQRWKDHVSRRPVWDNDNWIINYIGHPVSGAWYYTMGRNDGMTIGESAAFSALMSTFFWEYGYEAFSEVPSIQDIIFTPLFGSLFGEGMFILQEKLDQQGRAVLGSKMLGNVGYFFLDPMGNIADWMRSTLQSFHLDADVTMTIQTYPQAGKIEQFRSFAPKEDSIRAREGEIGFIITFW